MAAERILLFGAQGQVGRELQRTLPQLGELIALGRADADLADAEALRAATRRHRPSIIVNAGAYTAVDRAQADADTAAAVNATAPAVLAVEARALGAVLVHYSTDYVFDGRQSAPYAEDAAPNPLSVYGRTKLEGDLAIARTHDRHLIFRISWVYASHGANFLKTMLRLGAEREELRVVADQRGTPTGAALVADVTATALEALRGAPGSDQRFGTYHLAPAGETTWHAYARHVLTSACDAGLALRATPERVVAIKTADYPTPAARPANSTLDTTRLRTTFGLTLPRWEAGVDAVIATLATGNPR